VGSKCAAVGNNLQRVMSLQSSSSTLALKCPLWHSMSSFPHISYVAQVDRGSRSYGSVTLCLPPSWKLATALQPLALPFVKTCTQTVKLALRLSSGMMLPITRVYHEAGCVCSRSTSDCMRLRPSARGRLQSCVRRRTMESRTMGVPTVVVPYWYPSVNDVPVSR
jgi:hypothetical protein